MFSKRLALILAGMSMPALVVSAQQLQNHSFTYNAFHSSQNGAIAYNIFAEVTTAKWMYVRVNPHIIIVIPTPYPEDPPDPEPEWEWRYVVSTHRVDLLNQTDYYWTSPRGIFSRRGTTVQAALNEGVTQAAINALSNTPDFQSFNLFETSTLLNSASNNPHNTSNIYRAKGSVVLNVNIPTHPGNRWVLKIISALPEEKFYPITLTPGQHKITVTDVEAGNVLVGLFAVDANGNSNSFFQEAYALIRKNSPDNITMQFASSSTAPERYKIGYLGVGQNSQSSRSNLPLQNGREAMIRAMAYDSWGNGGEHGTPHKLTVNWSSPGGSGSKTFTTKISGHHTQSGRIYLPNEIVAQNNEVLGLGPKIPKNHVRHPLTVTTNLYNPTTNQLLDTKTTTVNVVDPRRIFTYGRDVISRFESGCPRVYNNYMEANILPFTEDVQQYSELVYGYAGNMLLTVTNTTNYLRKVLDATNALAGNKYFNLALPLENIYLGFTTVQDPLYGGMAFMGKKATAISEYYSDEWHGYVLGHEMGHCFNFKHAPSPGVDMSSVDNNYPYGGGGMAGGWGYTNIVAGGVLYAKFLAEDNHTPDNLQRGIWPHWDLMSYRPLTHETIRFSDYNVARLAQQPPSGPNPKPPKFPLDPINPVLLYSHIQGMQIIPGAQSYVFGADAANFLDDEWHTERYSHDFMNSEAAEYVDYSDDDDDELDLDDEEMDETELQALIEIMENNGSRLPGVIFTRLPKFKGLIAVE